MNNLKCICKKIEWPRVFSAILIIALAWGCGVTSKIGGPRSKDPNTAYNPPPGSAAFQKLRLDKIESVVVLNIEGDDAYGNMKKVYRVLLDKGYAIRDVDNSLEGLRRAGLLGQKSTAPEYLKKAAGIFNEQVAVAGRVEVVQAEPPSVLVALYFVDLKKQKILWVVKSSYVGRYFGVGNPFEKAVVESITNALSPLPRANP